MSVVWTPSVLAFVMVEEMRRRGATVEEIKKFRASVTVQIDQSGQCLTVCFGLPPGAS